MAPSIKSYNFRSDTSVLFISNSNRHGSHSPALDAGIDSVTLRLKISDDNDDVNEIAKLGQVTEHVLRGLNSLSERLHHNMNQYLMPSGTHFVSHSEYMVPCILILLPLVLRSLKLILELDRFHYEQVLHTIIGAISFSAITAIAWQMDSTILNAISCPIYFATILKFTKVITDRNTSKAKQRLQHNQSIQLVACLCALYVHVPLALANISLALPSSLLWVPLLAFPTFTRQIRIGEKIVVAISSMALFYLMHFTPGVNTLIDSVYKCFVFVPHHFIASVLWLS